ncbi:MAG: hypothetical protein WC895_03940 [Candidatus Shapirobacteria bacterium]|jgi:hypothetical protein
MLAVNTELKYSFDYLVSGFKVDRKIYFELEDSDLELLSINKEKQEIFLVNLISRKSPHFGYFYESSSETHTKALFDVLKTSSFNGFSKSGLLKEFTSYSMIKGCNPWFLNNNKFIH